MQNKHSRAKKKKKKENEVKRLRLATLTSLETPRANFEKRKSKDHKIQAISLCNERFIPQGFYGNVICWPVTRKKEIKTGKQLRVDPLCYVHTLVVPVTSNIMHSG